MKNDRFQGYLIDCLRDFRIRTDWSHFARHVAEYCNVTRNTAKSWFQDGGCPPGRESQIRLMCFLTALGYNVLEFERMGEARRNLTYLIGFSILTVEEAVKMLGCSNSCELFHIILDRRSVSQEQLGIIRKTFATRKYDVADKTADLINRYSRGLEL